ncbi:hypothetical protein, partial [Serratia marcescens]|uniref:hypothetical protein n=1 Tax=Serratia marcescens TaxID=615 RepID=UPI001952DF88
MANELPRHTEAIEPISARMGIQGEVIVVEAAEAGAAEDMGNSAGAAGGAAGERHSIAARHREIVAFSAARASLFIELAGLQ